MRIGQAIDEIFKDKNKEYQGLCVDLFRYTIKYDVDSESIKLSGPFGANMSNVLTKRISGISWELVQKPVTFMEAFEKYREGRTIEVVCGGMHNQTFKGNSNSSYLFHEEYIDNGKWYIKEDN